jgi:hypothetical protein
MACGAGCALCSQALTCLSCRGDFVMAKGVCYTACPDSQPIRDGTQCKPCNSPCTSCNASNFCLACSSPSLLLRGQCVDSCPAGFKQAGLACESTLSEQNSGGSPPLPCTLVAAVLAILLLVSKFNHPETQLITGLASLLAVLETVSWVVLCKAMQSNLVYGLVSALGLLWAANMAFLALYCCYLAPDARLSQHNKVSKISWATEKICLVIASSFNFRAYEFVFSRVFGVRWLSAGLEGIGKLAPFSYLKMGSLLASNMVAVVVSGAYLNSLTPSSK